MISLSLLRTRAVANKLARDFEKALFWITLVVQVLFFFFYGYSICTNISNIIFLITYSLLGLLSIFNFIYVLVTHPYHKNEDVKKVKFITRIFKYLINGTMVGVNLFEVLKFGGTDFNKIIIIVSALSLGVQIIIEIASAIISHYMNLFLTSIQMDLGPILKISKLKEVKGNFYEILDLPLEAIANKMEGKEVELSETEIYINELTEEFDKTNKQKVKEKSHKNAEKQKKEIVEHLTVIKNKLFKRKKSVSV